MNQMSRPRIERTRIQSNPLRGIFMSEATHQRAVFGVAWDTQEQFHMKPTDGPAMPWNTMDRLFGRKPQDDEGAIEAPYVSVHDVVGKPHAPYNPYENPTVPPVVYESDETSHEEDYDDMSMTSSVLTAEGIHDIVGFYCVCLVILIGDMSRGVMFPSMWPLVESLGGDQVLLGYSVAAFSFGRVLVNPLFGAWSHQFGYTRTLVLSTSILLLGTIAYTQIQTVGRPEFLIVSQTILGIGSGTLGVTRAFVADVTAKRQRTGYMGWITAVQYGGFTVTPVFGAFFNYMFDDNDYRLPFLPFVRFNKFTMPAIFMGFVVSGTLIVLLTFFRDRHRIATIKEFKKPSSRRQAIDEVANAPTFLWLTVYDCCILGCMLLNVSTKGSIAAFETLGISIAESHFEMVSSRAGFIVAACGTLGVISLINMEKLALFLSDLQMIMGGMVVMCIGIVSLSLVKDQPDDGFVGNPQWIYAFAMIMIYSIGYPVGHTAVIGLFSKIVGRRPQGTLLGYFASAGSVARMFFPIMSGYIARYSDIDTLFVVLVLVLLVSTAFVAFYRNILSLLSS